MTNVNLTLQEINFIIDGLKSRIATVEKLINYFTSQELTNAYAKEKMQLIELLNRFQSL
jgi:cell shape-determining protein MreC